MAGFSRIYCIGGLGGYMGSDGMNPILLQIWVGDASRQWLEAHYFTSDIKPLGKVNRIIPTGPLPDYSDGLFDACIVFFPEHFQACPMLKVVEKQLVDVDCIDFDMKHNVPPEWPELREEARELFNGLVIFEAELTPLGSRTRRRNPGWSPNKKDNKTKLAHYFQPEYITSSLDKYSQFVKKYNWTNEEKVRLYRLCGEAFSPNLIAAHQNLQFEEIYNVLHKRWQIFRPLKIDKCWKSAEIHEVLSKLPIECARGGTLTLPALNPDDAVILIQCIESMKGVKHLPSGTTPIMAVSKFLHIYNPRLFPIFDWAVIRNQVLPAFNDEWQNFPCPEFNQADRRDKELMDYLKYMFWAAYLMRGKEEALADYFSLWLAEQLKNEGEHEVPPSACREWYATAFECVAIGAMELQKC